MSIRWLAALPVFNEAKFVNPVVDEVRRYSHDVLVVDDGSTDGTAALLARRHDIALVTHDKNQGYGAALQSAFQFADRHGYDVIVTIDCDGQHEPQRMGKFVQACCHADIVSGSRYLKAFDDDSEPPADRRWINQLITAELNRRLGISITDAFCGFKAYRVESLRRLKLTENGYAMPLELWVQAAVAGLRIIELAVPLIYLDEERSFGGALDESTLRLNYYHRVLDESLQRAGIRRVCKPSHSLCGEGVG
jgi:dolichol-phosphate mannosyltransferase